ncbi:MAG: GTP-binding protein [Candidatus Hodarchaeales archaeon]|jgi:small GTP-binding protein
MSADNEYLLKICAIGSGNVGKTALIRKFAENKFDTNYLPTLGVDITTKIIEIDNDPIKLILVDTAGQEFFGKLRPSYYRGASACTIVFSQSDRQSFEAVPNWWREFCDYIPHSVPLALIGVTSDSEVVSSEEAQCLATLLNCGYFECTLKNGPQLAKVFEYLARQVIGKPLTEKLGGSGKLHSSENADIQIVRCLLLEEFNISNDTLFTREEVLNLWVQKERLLGNQESEHFLRNRLLRPRLSSVIKSLQQVSDTHLSLTYRHPKRGRPRALLLLNVPEFN